MTSYAKLEELNWKTTKKMWRKLKILEIVSGFEPGEPDIAQLLTPDSNSFPQSACKIVPRFRAWHICVSPERYTHSHGVHCLFFRCSLHHSISLPQGSILCVFGTNNMTLRAMKQNRSFRSSCATMTSPIVVRIPNQKWTFSRFSLALT